MRRMGKLFLCLLLCMLLAGCAQSASRPFDTTAPETSGAVTDSPAPDGQPEQSIEQVLDGLRALGESPDDQYRTWYEIFVYSFCDSDGDGIGDLQGVISKLDYLENLGINGIWLMPIHPSTTYHKYNVSDYYAIDPAYGTLEDFDQLIAECNARGIRVILDLVLNHSGSEHAWFQEACRYLRTLKPGETPDPAVCPYVDYYNFVEADSAPANYSIVTGTTDWYYESRFSYDMPDLNLGSEALREEIEDIMTFWLDRGVAGFRLDAAKEFYSGDAAKNIEVLNWIQNTATAIRPDCYLVAEVWDTFDRITEYYTSGITSIFNYAFGNQSGKIIKVLQAAGNPATVSTYATALEKADSAYRGSNPAYIDAPFLTNHDVGRIAGFTGRSAEKTKLAGAMNLFMSGSAFIYYGEEIGMVCGGADDPSYRAPMYWNAARDNGTTSTPPGCTLPAEYTFGSLEEQKDDPTSIYNYYRQAVAIRQALPVISHGQTTAETALNEGCISAQRKTWGEESCIILMNIDKETGYADLTDYDNWIVAATLSANGEPIVSTGNTLELPAYGVAVLIPAN